MIVLGACCGLLASVPQKLANLIEAEAIGHCGCGEDPAKVMEARPVGDMPPLP